MEPATERVTVSFIHARHFLLFQLEKHGHWMVKPSIDHWMCFYRNKN